MSTGQTRTYPFLQKDKTASCLPALCSMAMILYAFLGGISLQLPPATFPFSASKRNQFHGSPGFGWLAAIIEPFLQVFLE